MTDEKPKRVRGQKEREAAYRAGYADGQRDAVAELEARAAMEGQKEREAAYRAGYADGQRDAVAELEARAAMDAIREERIRAGLAAHRAVTTSVPKRTRRSRRVDIGAGTNPTVIHDAVTGEATPYERQG